ncbi:hypothetical protein SDC9_193412 [bioreactor metagenome]|uniref:Uncharacterized protein n=1 Tax=bioreactor metagenome TaxID=1076179 RepID=A0A645I617_9ZZZZ
MAVLHELVINADAWPVAIPAVFTGQPAAGQAIAADGQRTGTVFCTGVNALEQWRVVLYHDYAPFK